MQNQGYFVWKKEHQNYLMTDLNFQVLNPNTPLKVSTIAKEQRSMILQVIWCQKTGLLIVISDNPNPWTNKLPKKLMFGK